MGVVKDRAYGHAKGRIAVVAMMTLFGGNRRGTIRTAIGADWRITLPADVFEVPNAIRFGRKKLVNPGDVHNPYPML